MVDDSEADRLLCRNLLDEVHGQDFEFLEASDSEEGLKACLTQSPDCVLLDYRLAEMTGLEFLALLREEYTDQLPFGVVMLTALAREQVAVEALKLGAHDYLIKDGVSAAGLTLAIQKATQKVALIRALQAERSLAVALAEKEVLIKEVHHRVKNNLQVIASLLGLQAAAIGDQRLASALQESQNRVESMALIHEQLYRSADLKEVALDQHVRSLLANLLHSYGAPAGIAGYAEIAPLSLHADQAIPVGLILNELASNALKHAFPGRSSGCIRIGGHRSNGRIHLTVRDDGVGLPKDFDARRTKSLGLQIVNILTGQLKGTLELQPGAGTAFHLSFPEK